jgi:hypothetical protein
MKLLQLLLSIVAIGASTAESVTVGGDGAKEAAVAASLIAIAQKAIAAHEAVTGQPIDPSLLKPFEPIP